MRIDLSPGEALVLLAPAKRQGRDAFKLSLMWLLAQGHLTARDIRRWRLARVAPGHWRGGRTWTRLVAARPVPASAAEDVRAVAAVAAGTAEGYMDEITLAAVERFGADLDKLRTDVILPVLVGRGLVEHRDVPFLLFLKRNRPVLTAAGERLKERVEQSLQDARRIPDYLDRDPAQAAALAAALGALLLLLPELRPHLAAIAHAMRPPPTAGDSGGGSGGGSGTGPSEPASAPAGPGESPAFDFSMLGSVDAVALGNTLDGVASSFDSAAADAGGDGGGGDGGGGGD